MRTLAATYCAIVLAGISGAYAAPEPDGDRGHHLNVIYPADAFLENGGPIIDVTIGPYNIKGSGDPADADHNTKAFIAIYDFIMRELDKYGDMQRKVTQPSSTDCSYIIYIPDGVYYVNDTLIYSGPVRRVAGVQREYFAEIGTGKATERIMPLYISYRKTDK